jgi:predicted nucleic acid-binding protein
MRLLLDINVLLDVVFERPAAPGSSQVIARCGREHDAWLAWHSVATLAYLVGRQRSAAEARDFLRSLFMWADVAVTQRSDALQALDWPMPDCEDALQAAAAVACDARVILTRNVRDFKGSPVPAMTPEAFMRRPPPAPVSRRGAGRQGE